MLYDVQYIILRKVLTMICIENEFLTAKISNFGAELQNVTDKSTGTEYIWQGDPAVWNGRAPVLFPICGRLSEDTYYYGDESYYLPKHGFARKTEFSTESAEQNKASFILASNDRTRLSYPFEFELTVSFTLEGRKLITEYSVKNTDMGQIYFSLGAHPAYNVKLGGKIVFEKKEKFVSLVANTNSLICGTKRFAEDGREITLEENTFVDDALIFEAPKSTEASVVSPGGKTLVKMTFGKIPYLLLWAKPGADYVCIEPWNGIPDNTGDPRRIQDKKGIVTLEPGKEFRFVTTAEFFQ